MKKLLIRNILISVLTGLLGLWFTTETGGREPVPEPSGGQRTLIRNERLKEGPILGYRHGTLGATAPWSR